MMFELYTSSGFREDEDVVDRQRPFEKVRRVVLRRRIRTLRDSNAHAEAQAECNRQKHPRDVAGRRLRRLDA